MSDSELVDKLDRILDRLEQGSKPSKEDVLETIALLTREAPEDKVLLLQSEYIVKEYWHIDRKRIKENFDFVLNYFNILSNRKFNLEFRKTTPKKIEGRLAKVKFKSKYKDRILLLLGGDE